MAKYKWWVVLVAIYAAFTGLTALKYSGDSELASQGQFVYGKVRSSNPLELTFAAMDGKASWDKLTSRIDAEESKKALPAGALNFRLWFDDYTGIYGLGFIPFTVALMATGLAVVAGAASFCGRFRPATVA